MGDPALDLAKVSDDEMSDGGPAPSAEIAATSDPATAERLRLYWRAILLDWGIDPLADYLDAGRRSTPSRYGPGRNGSIAGRWLGTAPGIETAAIDVRVAGPTTISTWNDPRVAFSPNG